MIQVAHFSRKPGYVTAKQVSEDNMQEIAEWCSGTIRLFRDRKHVSVNVLYPAVLRHTQAFVGDWVLKNGSGYRVYTAKAFTRQYDIDEVAEENDRYVNKPSYVNAVRVTEENKEEVAAWCGGFLCNGGEFIKVHTPPGNNVRLTQAYVGDWVLNTTKGHKVYHADAFDKNYVHIKDEETTLETNLVP